MILLVLLFSAMVSYAFAGPDLPDQPTQDQRKSIGEARIRECCQAQHPRDDCMPLCHYYADPKQVRTKSVKCFPDLKRWVYCAADGQHNAGCCAQRGVPQHCQIFCNGEMPSNDDLYNDPDKWVQCLDKINDILTCDLTGMPRHQTWKPDFFPRST